MLRSSDGGAVHLDLRLSPRREQLFSREVVHVEHRSRSSPAWPSRRSCRPSICLAPALGGAAGHRLLELWRYGLRRADRYAAPRRVLSPSLRCWDGSPLFLHHARGARRVVAGRLLGERIFFVPGFVRRSVTGRPPRVAPSGGPRASNPPVVARASPLTSEFDVLELRPSGGPNRHTGSDARCRRWQRRL